MNRGAGDGMDDPLPVDVTDGPDQHETMFGRRLSPSRRTDIGIGAGLIWLAFIIFPLVDAVASKGSPLGHALAIAGAAAFAVVYAWLIYQWRRNAGRTTRLAQVLFVVLLVLATALTVANNSGWGFLFTYCAACTWLVAGPPLGFYGVLLCVVLAAAASLIGGANGGVAVGFVASSAGIGLLMLLMRDLRVRNQELSTARAELARLAVAEERERFARDLHDLLGHTLSVIALKAELAGRLLPDRPDEAATEVAEVEGVARKALGEVRETVSGYRKPTLDGEIEGARMALSAAGIDASIERPAVKLDPETEAVLAWAVREGATNVIRHSGAKHCQMRIIAGLAETELEIVDDGHGSAPSLNGHSSASNGRHHPGHGLAGLAERARGVRGNVDSGVLADGGFRLAVRVPRTAKSA
jgi:two-component system, NarL family, sensor histidine kinase DesK